MKRSRQMNNRRLFVNLTLVIVSAVIAGCGFRLQGTTEFPRMLTRTYIEAPDRYSEFYRQFSVALERGGIQLVSSPLDATAVIRITKDITGQRVLTISSRNVPTEYDVYYRISYSVSAGGKEVLPLRDLAFNQDYTFDETRLLGKNREEENIREAIASELVRQVSQELARLQ